MKIVKRLFTCVLLLIVACVCAGLWLLYGSKTSNPHNYATIGDIPWCLTLVIGQEGFAAHEDAYTALIEQGKKLGIYTYLLLAPQLPVGLFSLLQSQKDCPFHAYRDVFG